MQKGKMREVETLVARLDQTEEKKKSGKRGKREMGLFCFVWLRFSDMQPLQPPAEGVLSCRSAFSSSASTNQNASPDRPQRFTACVALRRHDGCTPYKRCVPGSGCTPACLLACLPLCAVSIHSHTNCGNIC